MNVINIIFRIFHCYWARVFVLLTALKSESSFFFFEIFGQNFLGEHMPKNTFHIWENEFHESLSKIANVLVWQITQLN